MLMRFDPFRDLDRLTQQMWDGWSAARPVMPMDAYRDGDRFTVYFDLPGVDPDSIELTVERDVLTVTAERTLTRGEETEVIAAERAYGTYRRQLFLGETLDTEHIDATYENGVLTAHIPVAEEAKPRRIEVTSGHAPTEVVETAATPAAA